MALAVCRLNNENKTYYWDIKCTGAVSKFDPTFFKETPEGLSLNVPAILATNPQIDELFNTVLTGNYSATSVYDLFIREIKILPGTMDGCIRYYINGDDSTMSDDVRLPGVQRLAFMEYVGEDEIKDNAVHSRHLLNKAVQMRHLADDVVFDSSRLTGDIFKANLFRADRYTLLGNIFNDDRVVHEVGLVQLGDLLRPIIGGWPDPAVPDSLIYGVPLTSPHLWKDNEPQTFADGRLGMRFRGTISVLPNRQITTNLDNQVTTKEHQLIDCGGSWRVNTVTKTDAVLGGSNITGHTFASIQMDQNGITLDSISIGDRQEAFYDVWVVYVPIWRACKHEWIEYTNPSNPTEMLRQCKKCHHKE